MTLAGKMQVAGFDADAVFEVGVEVAFEVPALRRCQIRARELWGTCKGPKASFVPHPTGTRRILGPAAEVTALAGVVLLPFSLLTFFWPGRAGKQKKVSSCRAPPG